MTEWRHPPVTEEPRRGGVREIEAATYCGEPIGTMSRDKLLDVIEHLSKRVKDFDSAFNRRAMTLGRNEMLKLGELMYFDKELESHVRS